VSRIGTVFPHGWTIVTLPGIHATQRMAYIDHLNALRAKAGEEPLSRPEVSEIWNGAVDLIMDGDCVLIRPDPENMELAFQADELLQQLVPKHKIKFLHVLNSRVREAIKRRGEYWRIAPLPTSAPEMQRMIAASRISIGGGEIYYHNGVSGTRFLTCQEFTALGQLDDDELRQHLDEVRRYGVARNARGCPEIDLFMADDSFPISSFGPYDFPAMDGLQLRQVFATLCQRFSDAVQPDYRQDQYDDLEWRNRMFAALIGQEEGVVTEETLLGLSSEFFMQIEWLPGGRIEEGELILDTVFEQIPDDTEDEDLRRLLDEKPRKFIFNFVREYGDLEYVNIGRVIGSLSRRPAYHGRRDVYIAVLKQRGSDREIVSIIRMQKWTAREHLNAGKGRLEAMIQTEEYTDYILDRRLGCRQLGMNLSPRVNSKRITETYPHPGAPGGFTLWTPYFERDYIRGIATDKLPPHKLAFDPFAASCARLLGLAAAPNLIVGRGDAQGPLFDDGDEVLILDECAMPFDIIVADHTGTFASYLHDLSAFAKAYASPVNRRVEYVPDPRAFGAAYLAAFVERFRQIQMEYRKRRNAFDTLFKHRLRDEAGSFAFRWECVLARLRQADPQKLADEIRSHFIVK
jgi:hypothetical protein